MTVSANHIALLNLSEGRFFAELAAPSTTYLKQLLNTWAVIKVHDIRRIGLPTVGTRNRLIGVDPRFVVVSLAVLLGPHSWLVPVVVSELCRSLLALVLVWHKPPVLPLDHSASSTPPRIRTPTNRVGAGRAAVTPGVSGALLRFSFTARRLELALGTQPPGVDRVEAVSAVVTLDHQ